MKQNKTKCPNVEKKRGRVGQSEKEKSRNVFGPTKKNVFVSVSKYAKIGMCKSVCV